MPKNLPLSITARIDRVTHYERVERRSCISISGYHGQSVVGASGLELGLLGRGRLQSGKNLGEVEVAEWWNAAPDRGCFQNGGRLWDD